MGGGRYSHPTMMASFFLVVVLFVCLLLLLFFFFTYFVCPLLYYLHVHDMIRFINVLSWGEKKRKKISKGTFDVIRKSYLLVFFTSIPCFLSRKH